MNEKPIIFNAPMVRAILDGRKSMTRRVVKPQPRVGEPFVRCVICDQRKHPRGRDPGMYAAASYCAHECGGNRDDPQPDTLWPGESIGDFGYPEGWEGPCPYGQPGQMLWVRETWCAESNLGLSGEIDYPPPFKDDRPVKRESDPDWGEWWVQCHYRATDPKPELVDENEDGKLLGWRPSIHLPKWAARIWLEITEVRVERLQEISHGDCIAEGFQSTFMQSTVVPVVSRGTPYLQFEQLWDSINAKRASWKDNPWVFVLTFKAISTTGRPA